jgi:hypothetical protein
MPRVSAKIDKFLQEETLSAAESAALRLLLGASGTVDAAAITDALQGAESDPERIGAEYLPEIVEVDYITLTDQSAGTIPNYALGRKGETPYFGNSPLVSGVNRYFSDSLATDVIPTRVELAEFPIAAESMVVGSRFYLELDIAMDFQTGTPAAEDVWIQIDFGAQADFTLGESILVACGATQSQAFKLQGVIELHAVGGDVGFSGLPLRGVALMSAYADTLATSIKGKVLSTADIQDVGVLSVPDLVANSIKIWVYNNTWADANSVLITGKSSLASI